MTAITREYERELKRAVGSREQRTTESVLSILSGVDASTDELDYRFDAWHLGAVAVGERAEAVIRQLALRANRELLLIRRDQRTVWGWFGGHQGLSFAKLQRLLEVVDQHGLCLAIGEPARSLEGWRLTHRQAQAAAQIAAHKPQSLTRYAGSMLVAAALNDDTLAKSLQATYVAPFDRQRDGGALLRETLLAYFDVGSNAATAAARLAVDRHTVRRRIDKVERVLGRPLRACQTELEIALRLEAIARGCEPQRREKSGAASNAHRSAAP